MPQMTLEAMYDLARADENVSEAAATLLKYWATHGFFVVQCSWKRSPQETLEQVEAILRASPHWVLLRKLKDLETALFYTLQKEGTRFEVDFTTQNIWAHVYKPTNHWLLKWLMREYTAGTTVLGNTIKFDQSLELN